MGEVLDLHIRIHDDRVRKYHREYASGLERPSRHYEELILMGLAALSRLKADKQLFLKGESTLPPIDLYHKFKILDLDLIQAFKTKAITSSQIYNVNLTFKALSVEMSKHEIMEIIQDVEDSGYEWRG